MALTKKEVTKKMLVGVAEDFNRVVLEKDSQIKFNSKTTNAILEADIMKCAAELLEPDDIPKFSVESVEVLKALGVDIKEIKETPDPGTEEDPVSVPDPAEDSVQKQPETPDKDKLQAEGEDQKKNKGEVKGETKKAKYTRIQAFCDALQGKPKTILEIAEISKKKYNDANSGHSKHDNIKQEVERYVKPFVKLLVILDFVVCKDKKYSLK